MVGVRLSAHRKKEWHKPQYSVKTQQWTPCLKCGEPMFKREPRVCLACRRQLKEKIVKESSGIGNAKNTRPSALDDL